jgi:RimJ/RimL family protein N-acetyltransferase
MTRYAVHKAPARERPGTLPARATRPAKHARATALRRLANWLRPGRGGGQPGARTGPPGARTGPPDEGSRPAADGRNVVLRDGSQVLIRPVRSTDASLIAEAFARLSERSRRMRFLGKKDELTAAELHYYANVDHHDHEALGALDPADGRGVGVARYVRDADDPQAAEIALTIADDWQGRGLGTELLARLSQRAREEGIRRFTAVMASENVPMGMLLHSVGAVQTGRNFGTLEYEIALERPEEYDLEWWFRCVEESSVFTWR